MSLPSDMRTALVDRLLESLNVPTQRNVDRLWAEEAERRIEEVHSGKVDTIPGNQVFEDIRRRFGK
ncbi:addiction module protein [bacterium]|nr:addiction module protein [bacterium]MBU1752258.1 addiction module protein [bacterium]